jgi:hypothetical protein
MPDVQYIGLIRVLIDNLDIIYKLKWGIFSSFLSACLLYLWSNSTEFT